MKDIEKYAFGVRLPSSASKYAVRVVGSTYSPYEKGAEEKHRRYFERVELYLKYPTREMVLAGGSPIKVPEMYMGFMSVGGDLKLSCPGLRCEGDFVGTSMVPWVNNFSVNAFMLTDGSYIPMRVGENVNRHQGEICWGENHRDILGAYQVFWSSPFTMDADWTTLEDLEVKKNLKSLITRRKDCYNETLRKGMHGQSFLKKLEFREIGEKKGFVVLIEPPSIEKEYKGLFEKKFCFKRVTSRTKVVTTAEDGRPLKRVRRIREKVTQIHVYRGVATTIGKIENKHVITDFGPVPLI